MASPQVFEYPLWDQVSGRNDIALLKLATPALLSTTASPVCLPSANTSFPAGSLCATTGWGKTRYNCECPCRGFSEGRLIRLLWSKFQAHKFQVVYLSFFLFKHF